MRTLISICIVNLLCFTAYAQDSTNKNVFLEGKLIESKNERIPGTKYLFRTTFRFLSSDGKNFTIHLPGDTTIYNLVALPPYGTCQLLIDTVYQFELLPTRISEINIGERSMDGFYYSKKYLKEDKNGIIVPKKAVREIKTSLRKHWRAPYVDIDGKVYKIVDYSPYHCRKMHFE